MNKDFSDSSTEEESFDIDEDVTNLDSIEELKNNIANNDTAIQICQREIKDNSDKIEEVKKDVKARSKDLEKDLARQKWLSPVTMITITLTLIGLVSSYFYHINLRVDNSHSRIDKIDDSAERICRIIETLSSHVNADDILQLPDCLP